jgi:hypothetical protein
VLSCLEMAFSKSPPSVDTLKLLEGSSQGNVSFSHSFRRQVFFFFDVNTVIA